MKLPEKTRKERDASRMVRAKAQDYPFGVVVPFPVSDAAHAAYKEIPDVEFFRQPFPRLKQAVWLFDTDAHRKAFVDRFGGERMRVQ